MRSNRLVLLIGGTRGTGLLIAQRLIERETPVRILARDPARAAAVFASTAEIVAGDITKPETLPAALTGAGHIIFTAGRPSARPVRERQIKETEYDGVLNTLAAARSSGFAGRFMYMTSGGVTSRSVWTFLLNLAKGNTLVWRLRAEEAIRSSGLDYSIVRAGVLLDRPGGKRAIRVSQEPLPLSPRYHIARADVADVFVASLDHPCASRATFDVVWGHGPRQPDWTHQLASLKPDGT